ncbi:hypothetical protein Taro_044843 [Colocasia esculenta]|uniref:Transcriptional regulatory protein n=1 Tax=Colocasia esculenta TaxID=4460 RepID=A0A843X5W3_COLES|nr:hypothetical protein [Colocasia esculenta]
MAVPWPAGRRDGHSACSDDGLPSIRHHWKSRRKRQQQEEMKEKDSRRRHHATGHRIKCGSDALEVLVLPSHSRAWGASVVAKSGTQVHDGPLRPSHVLSTGVTPFQDAAPSSGRFEDLQGPESDVSNLRQPARARVSVVADAIAHKQETKPPGKRPPEVSPAMAAASTVRALGALLRHGAPHGFPSTCAHTFHAHNAVQRFGSLGRCLSSPIPDGNGISSSANRVRRIWSSTPVCMGRRSSKIATRKGAQDAKKAKRYGKIGKEIVSAVKKGGPNPVSNTVLAAVLEKAKELDVPKEIVERNMKRASEKGQEAYIEKFYEVYGFGGVGMVVEVLTDKINRSVAAVREVVKDCGGKMADPGSIMFKFRRARVVNIKVSDADKDQLLTVALDAGAEDVIEPQVYEDDDSDEDVTGSYYKIVTSSENYPVILSKLRDEGITFEPDNGFELLPLVTIEVDDEAMDLNKELMSKLLDLDDVDAVYSDQK